MCKVIMVIAEYEYFVIGLQSITTTYVNLV